MIKVVLGLDAIVCKLIAKNLIARESTLIYIKHVKLAARIFRIRMNLEEVSARLWRTR